MTATLPLSGSYIRLITISLRLWDLLDPFPGALVDSLWAACNQIIKGKSRGFQAFAGRGRQTP